MTRIGFTGPFGDANLGDYGMLVNNILDLEPHHIDVFSYDPAFTNILLAHHFPQLRKTVVPVEVELPYGGHNHEYVPVPEEVMKLTVARGEISKSVEGLDCLVVNGGGYWNSLWKMPHRVERLLSIAVPMLMADSAGVPIVFTANGFGPFHAEDRDFFATILGGLSGMKFHVRDELMSPAALASIGVAESRVASVPDDLLILHPQLTQNRGGRVGKEPYVVLETYLSIDHLEALLPIMRAFVSSMKRRGLRVVFMPFHGGAGGQAQGDYLASVVDDLEVLHLGGSGMLPLEFAREIIQNAEAVVANRYHALVLALGAETPVLSALRPVLGDFRYYYYKARGALDAALGVGAYDRDAFLYFDLESALQRAIDDLDGVAAAQAPHRFRARVEDLRQKRQAMLDRVRTPSLEAQQ